MKTSRVQLVVIAALVAVAVIIPAARAVFNGVTDNNSNSFASAADFNTNPSFRVTTYEIKTAAGFTGLTHLLTLNQDLVADYFVMLRGAAGDYTSGGDRGPAADYARIERDPHGNFTGRSAAGEPDKAGSGQQHRYLDRTGHRCRMHCGLCRIRIHPGSGQRGHDDLGADLRHRSRRRGMGPRPRPDRPLRRLLRRGHGSHRSCTSGRWWFTQSFRQTSPRPAPPQTLRARQALPMFWSLA